jgi:hypothetical protein
MNGHRIELERLVQARVERVREVLTDVAHADQTLSGVEHVELITEGALPRGHSADPASGSGQVPGIASLKSPVCIGYSSLLIASRMGFTTCW